MMRDADFGIVRARAFGTYDFHITDPKLFLKEVAGSDQHFRLDEFADTMRSRIVSLFSEALAQSKIPVLDVAARYQEVGAALLPLINPVVTSKYGLEMTSFILENVSLPPEVEAAIDKRSSMAAVGNLNDYVKFQMAQGMGTGQSGGAGGFASEMAVGMAMAQQMMQQQGGVLGAQATPPAAPSTPPPVPPPVPTTAAVPPPVPAAPVAPVASTTPELLSPADAAKTLGVSEADVLQSLEAGDLKGKKIGSTWRITKAALDQFLQS
jgi:excisionase family DNA binding protein